MAKIQLVEENDIVGPKRREKEYESSIEAGKGRIHLEAGDWTHVPEEGEKGNL